MIMLLNWLEVALFGKLLFSYYADIHILNSVDIDRKQFQSSVFQPSFPFKFV